jgi:hypothetical protein
MKQTMKRMLTVGLLAGLALALDARDGCLERLMGKEAEVPSYETVSALFPLPGTKRIYLHQPCDTMIVEARPDLKLTMKRALGGGPVTGLGFVLSGAGQEGNFDYTRTRPQFEEQAFPLLKQTVAQAGFVFEQTAFTTTDDSDRRLVMIRLRVTPESGAAADALALAWLSVAQPQHLFYSHGNEDYIVFEPWGAAWGAGLDLQVENNVQHDGKTVFAVFRTGKNVSLAQAENPRLKKHLIVNLDFRQTKEAVIEVCVPYASGPGTPWPPDKAFRLDEAPKLIALSFDKEYARQAGQWRALGERAAKISVPEALVNQIYRTLTLNNLQFLGSAPGVAFCKPGQGGFNTFSTVYGWESSNFLTVMDRQGFHDETRRVLDFFLTTQQGPKGQGPNGDISTAEGSFRPHIHWMCESGAILRVFAEHALSAGDADGLRRDSPALLKAARWIQHERSRTKEIGADGKKVPYYGLMPKGLATDWPDYVYSFWTDAYTWQGLDRLATAYETAGLPEGKWLREEAADYHRCILDAVTGSIKPHPLDPALRWLPSHVYEDPAQVLPKTLFTGPFALVDAKVFPSEDPIIPVIESCLRKADCLSDYFALHMKTMEDESLKSRQEQSAGGKADLYYVNLGEKSWHRIWLERGERLKALRFFYATLAYSTSRDVHMVHERYCPQLPWLLPWQPNASGNGRVLEMILNTLLFEKGDTLCLLYGVPDAWFAAGKPLGISGLSLTSGKFSFSVKPQPQPGSYVFSYECGNRVPSKFLLALPSGSGREARRIVEIAGQNRKSATHIIPAAR